MKGLSGLRPPSSVFVKELEDSLQRALVAQLGPTL